MKDEEILQKLGERIKELRLKKGYSQEELAKKVGYTSRSTINKIEKGFVNISQSKILDFANILDTTPFYLLSWIDCPNDNRNLIQIQRKGEQTIEYYLSDEATEEIISLIEKHTKKEQK